MAAVGGPRDPSLVGVGRAGRPPHLLALRLGRDPVPATVDGGEVSPPASHPHGGGRRTLHLLEDATPAPVRLGVAVGVAKVRVAAQGPRPAVDPDHAVFLGTPSGGTVPRLGQTDVAAALRPDTATPAMTDGTPTKVPVASHPVPVAAPVARPPGRVGDRPPADAVQAPGPFRGPVVDATIVVPGRVDAGAGAAALDLRPPDVDARVVGHAPSRLAMRGEETPVVDVVAGQGAPVPHIRVLVRPRGETAVLVDTTLAGRAKAVAAATRDAALPVNPSYLRESVPTAARSREPLPRKPYRPCNWQTAF